MFSYTVEKNASKQTFEMVCRLIESHFTGIVKEKLLEDGTLMKTPIVRNGRQATVGYQPDVWAQWE